MNERNPGATPGSMVPLHDELDFVAAYLKFQQAGYSDRLTSARRPAPRVCLVPALIVQLLAENAVRHGTARSESGIVVEVCAHRDGDRLHIRVSDGGPTEFAEA